MTNIILATDSYKASHFKQYPPGTTKVTSYIEARAGGEYDHVLFFGLQAFVRKYLLTPISRADVLEAKTLFAAHGVPYNEAGWMHIIEKHGGYLPLVIEGLPEGCVVPVGTPLVQVYNTDPECFWLTSYIETALLRAIWYPSTVATHSWWARQRLRYFVTQTTDNDVEAILDFMLHDFGARGVTSAESAMLGGMAHLINFKGTDTVEGMLGAMRYYDADAVPAFSVPASEHSTMTSWGREHEADAYANMMQEFPTGIVSIVADSYDYERAVTKLFCDELKDLVDARAGQGRVVIRPDSGDPVKTVIFTLHELAKAFGHTNNSRGFAVLPDHVRILWGDGIGVPQMQGILATMSREGFAAENIVFGMGGGLLQKVTRDTLRFAMKANEIVVGGEVRAIAKQPKTDPSKGSKAGAQSVVWNNFFGALDVMPRTELVPERDVDLLQPVYVTGVVGIETNFQEVRRRSENVLASGKVKKSDAA